MKSFLIRALAAAAIALALLSCSDDRLAGSSTEAGNAGGKLFQPDGKPAAGISVALVSRTFVPDTGGMPEGNRPGAYYRTRTGPDGRFIVEGVAPGQYRVMAIGEGAGAMSDSVVVHAGPDTAAFEAVLKPLGAVHGVVDLVGSDAEVNLWVSPVATVKRPPLADAQGAFRLDSLPEGEYDLLPQCFSCAEVESPYRVKVVSGKDTLLPDTLKVYPEIMAGFPDSGEYEVRAAWLPLSFEGKWDEGVDRNLRPTSALWTWNGQPVPGKDLRAVTGLKGTSVDIDTLLFGAASTGRLRVVLTFPDTLVSRAWTLRLDRSRTVYPLQAVEAGSAYPVRGPAGRSRWRIRPSRTWPLERGDVAFWGLEGMVDGSASGGLPEWITLAADPRDTSMLAGRGGRPLTFLLVPDSNEGGRILRPRRDERLEDFSRIRLFDRARLGFTDTVVPSLREDGLLLDRQRRTGVRQRYAFDPSGAIKESLGDLAAIGLPAGSPVPLFFHRLGKPGSGFSWDSPVQDAVRAVLVTADGRARQLGAPDDVRLLPPVELAALDSLLAPLAGDPPLLRDTVSLPEKAALEYVRYRGRGHLRPTAAGDSLLGGLKAWMVRNGLHPAATGFPLATAEWRFEGFLMDPGYTSTGDTLILDLKGSGQGAEVREFFTAGSASFRSGDTAAYAYRLVLDGDSLCAVAGTLPVPSRLFGALEGTRSLFAVSGLQPVTAPLDHGLPVLAGGTRLSGLLQATLEGWGRTLTSPGLLLDNSGAALNLPGFGFLHTTDGGLERAWRFGGRSGAVKGWNRL